MAPANSNTAMSAGSRLATVDEEAVHEAIDLRNLRKKKVRGDDNCSDSSSKRKSQRLSYVGSEINIIPNPQVGGFYRSGPLDRP